MSSSSTMIAWLMGALLCGLQPSALATPGQLPLGYRISAGGHPWTGRLEALAFRTTSLSSQAILSQWEAGDVLDRQDIDQRRLYLGGGRLDPLRWFALDVDTQAILNAVEPTGTGQSRISWLRGSGADAAHRPRDTRLASATGARVHVVPPPRWLPMQPGHTPFRNRYAQRRTTVWLGTRDGLLHGFDAVTGQELAAYLPRTLLRDAASVATPGHPLPPAPCPRPESIDADPAGTWRTLLLCAIPANRTNSSLQAGAVFVLDVSDPDAATPIGLLWEIGANAQLPLSGSGPVRAAMWMEYGVRRWAAITILAPEPGSNTPAALALLPLDRPVSAWHETGKVRRFSLPASGCGVSAPAARLLATTVRRDASGVARAAYASDDRGRLWRFGLDHLSRDTDVRAPICMHRHASSSTDTAEPPVVIQTGTGPMVVYSSGSELSAIPDRSGTRREPSRIEAVATGDGVVLQSANPRGLPGDAGWTMRMPRTDKRIDTLHAVSPVHLAFTTVTPDGQQRSYLVDAARGVSVTVKDENGAPVPAATGLPWDGQTAMPIITSTPTSTSTLEQPRAPATSTRETFDLAWWRIEGDTALPMQEARWHRQRGRLGWRELIRTPQ